VRRCTQEQAWRFIRALGAVDAGRLTAYSLIGHVPHIPAGTLSPQAVRQLHDSLYPPADAEVTGDSICFVVCSDQTPVAWLTYHAQVVTPDADLSAYQADHQAQAVAALSQLTRRAVEQLARLRDHREGRNIGAEPDVREQATRVLVANPDDPTLTWWTSLDSDVQATREHLAALTRTTGCDALIVTASGYGAFQRGSHPLLVPVLCAIDLLAAEHDLPASVMGVWLAAEGAGRNRPDAAQIVEAFTACYVGVFAHRRGFAEAERDRLGWTTALSDAGIPPRLFDLHRYAADLFTDEARGIALPDGRIAVFRRNPV
jgi:hypothetical protein